MKKNNVFHKSHLPEQTSEGGGVIAEALPSADRTAISTAEIPKGLNQDQIERMSQSFLGWYITRGELHGHQLRFSDVLSWAKSVGIDLDSNTFGILKQIFETAGKALQDALLPMFLSAQKSDFSYTELMLDEAAAIFEAKEREKEQEAQCPPPSLHRSEVKPTEQPTSARTIVNTIPLSPNSAAAQDLDWKLLTKNLPNDEIDDVIRYLAELQALLQKSASSLDQRSALERRYC